MAAQPQPVLTRAQDRSVTITLNSNGYPVVDDSKVHVSKRNNEQVSWQNETEQKITIRFSPFDPPRYAIDPHKTVGSGPSTAPNGTYKYSITVESTGNTTDPDVVIEN